MHGIFFIYKKTSLTFVLYCDVKELKKIIPEKVDAIKNSYRILHVHYEKTQFDPMLIEAKMMLVHLHDIVKDGVVKNQNTSTAELVKLCEKHFAPSVAKKYTAAWFDELKEDPVHTMAKAMTNKLY